MYNNVYISYKLLPTVRGRINKYIVLHDYCYMMTWVEISLREK